MRMGEADGIGEIKREENVPAIYKQLPLLTRALAL